MVEGSLTKIKRFNFQIKASKLTMLHFIQLYKLLTSNLVIQFNVEATQEIESLNMAIKNLRCSKCLIDIKMHDFETSFWILIARH